MRLSPKIFSGGLVLFAVILLFVSLRAEAVAAANCGDVVTQSVKLRGNLNCVGTGLTIGAPNVTVDLNGYTLSGDGTGIGIDNQGGFDNVTVKSGTIQNFSYGVFLTGADYNKISKLTIKDNKNITGKEGVGILLWLSNNHNEITKNIISGNDRQGIYLGCNPWDMGTGVATDCDGHHADYNEVAKNEIKDNGQDGFDSYGIQLHFANHNDVAKNQISGHNNWFFGVGIYVLSSTDNVLDKNIVTDNRFGSVLWDGGYVGLADDNQYHKNEFNGNGDAGIRVYGATAGVVLEKNVANNNGFYTPPGSYNVQDGIRVNSAGVSLRKNTANNNKKYGIEATGGVVDAGKNEASGNGGPAQCSGIVCL